MTRRSPDRVELNVRQVRSGGVVLTVVLVAVKSTVGVGLPWWLVLCPVWLPLLLGVEVIVGVMLDEAASALRKSRTGRRRSR